MKKINLRQLSVQYIIGLVVNIGFLVLLLSTDVSYRNIQIPEGKYEYNLARGTDVLTYLYPARNYLEHGVFGLEKFPDYHRTIGLPLYLAVIMNVFGNDWLIFYFFIQAALFAAIYPALSVIVQILFPDMPSLIKPTFFFFLLSGAYFTREPQLLTDLLFTVLFTIGLCFSLLAITRQNWNYLIFQLLFMGYAAQVRPTLIYYPIINLLFLSLIGCRHGVIQKTKVKVLIFTSFIFLLLLGNAPSIRNYIHHGLFKPTDVLDRNFFYVLGKWVMKENDKLAEFKRMEIEVSKTKYLNDRGIILKKYAFEIYKRYPWTVARRLFENSRAMFLSTHWLEAGRYWGINWQDFSDEEHLPLKKSNFIFSIFILWCLIYAVINIFFLAFLWSLIKQRDWFFLITILLLVSSFLAPSLMIPHGARMRLPVEGIIVICAFYAMSQTKYMSSSKLITT